MSPKNKKLSFWKKSAYGAGGFAENFFHNALNIMATPFLNIGFGVSPALVSLAMTIPRFWDAITDPIMGLVSDNFRSRFGRRRPFVFVGGILTAIAFAAIWWIPQGMSQNGTFFAFLAMLFIYYTCFTVFVVPYLALGFEMTPDYHERTRVMSYRSFFSTGAGFAMNWLFWLTQREVFDGIVDGMRWVGIGCGIVLACAAMVPALFVQEAHRPKPEELPKQDKGWGLVASIKGTLSTRPFLLVVGACVSVIIGVLSIMQVGMYVNIFYVAAGDTQLASTIQGVAGSCYQITALLTVPVVAWLGTRLGKQRALMLILSLGIVGSLSSWFTFTPTKPYLQIASLLFSAPAITGLWILAPAMIADVCDYDDARNGRRREGMFGAAYGWFTKIGGSLALLVSGWLLVATGFNVALEAGQGPQTLIAMRALITFVPAFFFGLAIFVISRYPITERMANEIRERLGR